MAFSYSNGRAAHVNNNIIPNLAALQIVNTNGHHTSYVNGNGRSTYQTPPHIRDSARYTSSAAQNQPTKRYTPPPPAPSTYAHTSDGKRRLKQTKGTRDIENWQFWPHAMAMDQTNRLHYGYSFLAFNFKKEVLSIKSEFMFTAGGGAKQPGGDDSAAKLPPAFSPLDAELPFTDISREGIRVKEENRIDGRVTLTVTVTCRRPPRFFTAFEKKHGFFNENEPTRRSNGGVHRRRATAMDFVASGRNELHAGILSSVPQGAIANPTFWNTYHWTFIFTRSEVDQFYKCAHKLRLLANDNPDMVLMSDKQTMLLDRKRPKSDWEFPELKDVDFGSRALIEGLVGNGILIPGDTLTLVDALKIHTPGEIFRHHLLESLFTEDRIRDPHYLVAARARFLRAQQSVRSLDHLVRIRSVQVTPTRVLVNPPQQETSNSVTRKYAHQLDAIIRVQFVDEGDRLHILDYTKEADKLSPEVGLMARVRRALQHGVIVAGQRFYPVASSSSQQKEHSMWFVNNAKIDRIAMARWMGVPTGEKVVAKYAARMGLAFSASRGVDTKFVVTNWKDIERLGNCFTDGCSIAGQQVMKEAAAVLGVKGLSTNPSAIQFRLGGAKGVLVKWPGVVADDEIRLRPSQVKFSSKREKLNVIRVSHYQVGFLNRQFIMIMSSLGVPDELFVKLFEDEVSSIRGLASRVWDHEPSAKDFVYLGIYTSFPIAMLVKSGFHQNPFIQDLCNLIECRALQDLKWRARIRLPESVYLIGVNDESGLLKEGELFCQYQKDEQSLPVVVEGKVLICRAPALHPGDVRRAVAVNVPELRHLKNVIVFNTAGPRPLPNMLGGGDLDGDDYTLIWDKRFTSPHLKVVEPMDYTAPKPKTVEKVQQEHLNENFVQYILNDVLGQVDNAHLANADITSPFDKVCMQLSEVHSAAVDFAKTGIAVDVDREWFPSKWPDFMGKDEDKTYRSHKILGQLFRQVHPMPTWDSSNIAELNYPCDKRFENVALCPQLIEALSPVKAHFEQAMTYTMRRYRVNESEVVAGIATQTKTRKRSRELSHLHEPLKDAFEAHTHGTRELAFQVTAEVQRKYNLTFRSPKHMVAAHAFAMTFKKELVEEYETTRLIQGLNREYDMFHPTAMLSFGWIWAVELAELAQWLETDVKQPKAQG